MKSSKMMTYWAKSGLLQTTRPRAGLRPAGPRWIVGRVQFSWVHFSRLASRLRRSARRGPEQTSVLIKPFIMNKYTNWALLSIDSLELFFTQPNPLPQPTNPYMLMFYGTQAVWYMLCNPNIYMHRMITKPVTSWAWRLGTWKSSWWKFDLQSATTTQEVDSANYFFWSF